MAFVRFTRPDGSPVTVNAAEIKSFAPVPTEGPLTGPLTEGTRLVFNNNTHQDVKELQAEAEALLA